MSKKKKRDIPIFDHPIFETHCHLDYLKERSTAETIALCGEKGINKLITISVSPDNLDKVIEIAKTNEDVFCTQGIHPHEAKQWSDNVEKKILENSQYEKVVAIGEIGLDFHYNNSPKEQQIEVFKRQLEIATEKGLPVVIHSRDADAETIAVLEEMAPKMPKKGVIHSFTSGPELAKKAIELGFHLGFNGIITFKNAEAVRDIVNLTPLDRILLETDSPFLTPMPYRGQENGPQFLPFIAEKIAEIKQVSIDEVLQRTYTNSIELFLS